MFYFYRSQISSNWIWSSSVFSFKTRQSSKFITCYVEMLFTTLQVLFDRRNLAYCYYLHGQFSNELHYLSPPPQLRHLQLAHTISPVFLMEGDRFFPRTATLKNEIPHLRFPQQYNFYPFKSLSLSFLFTFLMFAFYYLPFRSYLHHNHHFISNPLSWQALLYHIEWIL